MDPIKLNIIIEKDGNAYCAHWDDFVDIQVSECAFGDTTFEAVIKLLALESTISRL